MQGAGTLLTLKAYDVNGALLGSTSVADTGGATLGLALAGINRVEFIGNGSTAVDDFTFNTVSAATPEPGAWALLLSCTLGGSALVRRKLAR